MKFLDYMVTLFLIFGGTAILFSTAAAPFHTPTNTAQVQACSAVFPDPVHSNAILSVTLPKPRSNLGSSLTPASNPPRNHKPTFKKQRPMRLLLTTSTHTVRLSGVP